MREEYGELHHVLVGDGNEELEAAIASGKARVRSRVWANMAAIDAETSAATGPGVARPAPVRSARGLSPLLWAFAGTAACAALAFGLGIRYDRHHRPAPVRAAITQRPDGIAVTALPSSDLVPQQQQLESRNAELAAALAAQRQRDQDLQDQLADENRQLAEAVAAQDGLRAEVDRETALVRDTQAQLDSRKTALEQAQSATSSDSATIAGLQVQVHDLNARLNTENVSLDRERELLSHGREIRDIIGARNLHIIDVYDTDTEGATRKPFARAFYTEGKSLVYYAYDLPQRKVDEGRFSYVAWGESNGSKASIRKIGILFHDDQTQTRWSLNFADPQVLREIDSVFITLERTDTDVTQPKGKRLLTAYLGTAPNHP
jgi:hypothetical protein